MKTQFILTPYFLDQLHPKLESLAAPGWVVNKPDLPDGNAQTRMGVLHKAIATQVSSAIAAGRRPVSIAGDCCTTIGVTAGLQQAGVAPFLIWFDAHGDFNTWETTPSGFLGGMPLAMLAGLGEQTMPISVGLRSLPFERIVLTDGRDLDPGEQELLAGSGITHYPDPKRLLDISFRDFPLYIHFDTDIINPLDAPAMSYIAQGGPRASELKDVFRSLAQNEQIVAVSLTTWEHDLDQDGRSEETSMQLLEELLGG